MSNDGIDVGEAGFPVGHPEQPAVGTDQFGWIAGAALVHFAPNGVAISRELCGKVCLLSTRSTATYASEIAEGALGGVDRHLLHRAEPDREHHERDHRAIVAVMRREAATGYRAARHQYPGSLESRWSRRCAESQRPRIPVHIICCEIGSSIAR